MPPRKRGKAKKLRGGAWYDDLWSGVKSIAGPINDIAKATKIGSTLAGMYNPAAGAVVSQLGYGRRRKMKGGGAHNVILV